LLKFQQTEKARTQNMNVNRYALGCRDLFS